MKPTVLTLSHSTKCRSCPVRQDIVGTSPEPSIWGEQVMPRCFRYHIQSKTKTFRNFETACLKIFKASFFKIIQMFLNNMLLKNTTRNGNKLICNGTSLYYFCITCMCHQSLQSQNTASVYCIPCSSEMTSLDVQSL